MNKRMPLRIFLLVVAILVALPAVGALDVYAQGGPPASPQMSPGGSNMQHEVRGMIKDVDPSGRMLTLDDGTQLTIPPTVQLPGEIKEGAIVKASFEEHAGQKVITSLEVQRP
jgi:hypothetical protein